MCPLLITNKDRKSQMRWDRVSGGVSILVGMLHPSQMLCVNLLQFGK